VVEAAATPCSRRVGGSIEELVTHPQCWPTDRGGAHAPQNNAMNLTNREVPGMKERRPSGEPEHG
jgi:hypothetical protein